MRSRVFDLFLVLAVLLLIGAGVVMVGDRNWWPKIVAAVWPDSTDNSAARVGTPAAKETKPAQHEHKQAASEAPSPQPVLVDVAVVHPAPAKVTATGFPTEQQIPVGTPRSDLVGEFGSPDVTATGADRGSVNERYVYVDKGSHRRTFVALVNGKVASAETLSQ